MRKEVLQTGQLGVGHGVNGGGSGRGRGCGGGTEERGGVGHRSSILPLHPRPRPDR